MDYRVNIGVVKYGGKFHTKGKIISADGAAFKKLIRSGYVSPLSDNKFDQSEDDLNEHNTDANNDEMSVKELKELIETVNNVEYIIDLLEEENKKGQPRKTAIEALENRVKELQDEL